MADSNDKTPALVLVEAAGVSKAFSRTQPEYSTPTALRPRQSRNRQIVIGLVKLAALREGGYG